MINYNINYEKMFYIATVISLSSFMYYYYYRTNYDYDYKIKKKPYEIVYKPNKNGNNVKFSNIVKVINVPNRFDNYYKKE